MAYAETRVRTRTSTAPAPSTAKPAGGNSSPYHLKNWRVLTKLRLDVKWATRLVRALMLLTQHEIAR